MLEITIKPEVLVDFGPLPLTNSLLSTWLLIFFILFMSFWGVKRLRNIPSRLQVILETLVETWLGLCDSVAGPEARRFFPFITTLFIFIILSNFLGLIPGLAAVGIIHGPESKLIPLLRAPTADLNTTLALAIVAFIFIELEGISHLGLSGHLRKFFINPLRDKIGFFVGILELLSEFTRIISFSFRLFGNIFAGEVLLAIMTFLIPLLVPVPFLGMEIFTGFIQAFVFAMLTLVFSSLAVSSHAAIERTRGGEQKR